MSDPNSVGSFEPLKPSLEEDPFVQLERIFVYFLQGFFEQPEFEGTGMRWLPDEKTTEMIISSEKPRLEALQKTPHLTAIVGAASWAQLGLDQMQKTKMSTGERTHTDLIPLTVAYHCQTKEGTHARRIAWYASFGTNVLRRVIMRQGKLHQVAMNHTISGESDPTAYVGQLANEEMVSVVVTVPFFWQPQWVIRDPAPLLREIRAELSVRLAKVKPFTVRGRPAVTTPMDRPIQTVLASKKK